eukprot:SM000025S08355  [mRNA]  locus=s25:201671:204171:+ [translate_table: standard]
MTRGGGGDDGYARGPPWVFTGNYTLGGLYLAQYDSSPADRFDEVPATPSPPCRCASLRLWARMDPCTRGAGRHCVEPAHILRVSTPSSMQTPASRVKLRWAARVLVNSRPARDHGIMVDAPLLPSDLASLLASSLMTENHFANHQTIVRMPKAPRWLQMPLLRSSGHRKEITSSKIRESLVVEDTEGADLRRPLCRITLPTADERSSWSGLRIRMSLPSFSGRTQSCPELLKYSCSLHCGKPYCGRVRVVKPAVVALLDEAAPHTQAFQLRSPELARPTRADLQTILQGKPVFTIAFDHLYMEVAAPLVTKAKATSRREHLAVAKKHLEAEPVPVS